MAVTTTGGWLLLALLLLPLVGSMAVAPLRRNAAAAKTVALGFAVAELALVGLVWALYDPGAGRLQLPLSVEWIPAFGTDFALGIDGIALTMIALTGLLVAIVMGSSWAEKFPENRPQAGFYALLLAIQSSLVGVFAATDVFLFYVFFEVSLVPMYFLIGRFGGPRRQYAAVKFFLYSVLGGFLMLAAVIGLFVVSGNLLPGGGTFDWAILTAIADQIPRQTQVWLFLGFFAAFAIKAPLVPLHTWLPDAGAEAPIGTGVLLVGVLDKIGIYGFLRYCLPLFPDASRLLAPLVLVLAVIGVLYAALQAVGQTDLKRYVSYTSVAHFGFIALGVFAFTVESGSGAVLYMVNHGITTGMLFIVVGMVIARGGSRLVTDYGGAVKLAPMLAGTFLFASLAMLALPGTNSFVSEFLVLIGSFSTVPVYAILAICGIILSALYALWVYQQVMQGPLRGAALVAAAPGAATNPDSADPETLRRRAASWFPDLSIREIAVLTPLVVLILLLGFYPQPVLNVITPSVQATLSGLGSAAGGA